MVPIVLGNDPGEKARGDNERIALIGQVMVRVRGIVTAGDFIVASGLDDGTGTAVSPECITPEQFQLASSRQESPIWTAPPNHAKDSQCEIGAQFK